MPTSTHRMFNVSRWRERFCKIAIAVASGGILFLLLQKKYAKRRASSSQAPYPSLPHKCESSSIPLLVLSKMQTLRWFAFWFYIARYARDLGAERRIQRR